MPKIYADFIDNFQFNRQMIKQKIKSETDTLNNILKTAISSN